MGDDFNKDTSRYGDYFDYYFDDDDAVKNTNPNRNNRSNNNRNRDNRNSNNRNRNYRKSSNRNYGNRNGSNRNVNRNIRKRKGLKWKLLGLLNKRVAGLALVLVVILIIIIVIASAVGNNATEQNVAVPETTAHVNQDSYQIKGVPIIVQDEFLACCETYACTMLLQYYDFNIDVSEFVNNYLTIKPVSYGEDGTLYGPDMNSAFAGDILFGYGINAPGMAKCMNNFIKTTNSKLTAYPIIGESMEDLCKEYVRNNIPVMIWSTAGMQEPFVKASWTVNYVDENATHKIGDTVDWNMHEHCMVLVGYDKENYYLCDSIAGDISVFEKTIFEERYSQIGTQAIVVK